ncbi:MAG TPA: DUF488 domain-containing protein [Spirochaetia bacterium]|nr:DUF488 domain-containing protein [Spirochaetia bacterium]
MKLYTIGFTKKSARDFFEKLRQSGTGRVVDVRLNNVSQLSGFAKKDDLAYLLKAVCGIDYVHLPQLAPTQEILKAYRHGQIDWPQYEAKFLELIRARRVDLTIDRDLIAEGCLLCSEDSPEHCHRRLVAEFLKEKWGGVDITHLR